MDEIEAAVKKLNDNKKSTLFDEFERLSVEIQINQAMLRRSLSEPGTSMVQAHLWAGAPAPARARAPAPAPAPALVRQPVKQGKRSSWGGLNKVIRRLIRPVFWKKKGSRKDDDHEKEQDEFKQMSWKRFSKSVRFY